MKYRNLIRFITLGGCCSGLLGVGLFLPSVQASEAVSLLSVQPATGQQAASKRVATNRTKSASVKSLGSPSIDLAKAPQVLAQQSPSNVAPPLPGTEPQNPPLPQSSTQPQTEPQVPQPQTEPPASTQPQADPQFPNAEEVKPNPATVAPGRTTRSGSSYVGIGANIGAFGTTSVGSSGLLLFSKVGLTRYFSVRPAVVTDFSNDATFILPATFDFAPIRLGSVNDNAISVAPYIGAGAAVATDGDVRPLLTGGIDVPINSRFTATLGLNTTFSDDVDLGGFIGVGYNF